MSTTTRTQPFSYSIVILTFNRGHLLRRLLEELEELRRDDVEVIVVDNASDVPASAVADSYPGVTTVRAPRNLGAAGRNLGFEVARGDIIICLDDDVFGLSKDARDQLGRIFSDSEIAAVNFKVLEEGTGRIVNWVHHREVEKYCDSVLIRTKSTEGAVAFRRSALVEVGGYPEPFFLSHEGPDLAFRIMNKGWRVIYSPAITVTHSFAPEGRKSWRNYYFDTRNTFWLAIRNLPLTYGTVTVLRQTAAMFFYALRDGYLLWWARAVWHGLRGVPQALRERKRMTAATMRRIREIDSYRPSLIYTLKKRWTKSGSMRL